MSLQDLRRQLDELDSEIVKLLRRRADIALEVGEAKREAGLPFYAPEREREILDRLVGEDSGHFPAASIRAIFREILSACLAIQQPLTIAYLGPAGTFTEAAARQIYGAAAEYLAQPTFPDVFAAVEDGRAHFGVVPVENSTAGTIREVLDLLWATPLVIIGETYVDIRLCLLSQTGNLLEIETVYSKDTALEQCRAWLRGNLPQARLAPVASTAEGAARAVREPRSAAIAQPLASDVYDLPIQARNIQDRTDNRTRFFVLGQTIPPATGADKTSLVVSVPHEPGALVTALNVFRDHGLNMTMIESRPSHSAAFEYVFFIDLEGHIETPELAAAIADLKTICRNTEVLGSYPRAAG